MTDDWHDKGEAFWRARLTPEQFAVCRMKGTERPFTGIYNREDRPGQYFCVCCGNLLFDAATKFDAGCGWPSFYQTAVTENITETPDFSHGMVRTEITCTRCGSHLGHVFEDGPAPTGLRYCLNSVSLDFVPEAHGEDDRDD